MWTELHGTEQAVDGGRRCYYDSGIEFTGLTPERQTALIAALETLQTP